MTSLSAPIRGDVVYYKSVMPSQKKKKLKPYQIRLRWFLIGLVLLLLAWRRRVVIHQRSLRAFVPYNGYRLGAKSFAAIGLSAREMKWRTKFDSCTWLEHGGAKPVKGVLKAYYPGEHHDLKYEALVIHCHLHDPTHPTRGGKLFMRIHHETFLVLHEKPNAFPLKLDPHPPYKHHVAFCSPPVHSRIEPRRLYEWLEYHLYLGLDYVIIYDAGGITPDVVDTLMTYEMLDKLEVRSLGETLDYDSWLYGQVMAINDCVYSTRYTATWTLFFDFDEFFNADTPPARGKVRAHTQQLKHELQAEVHWQRQLAKLQRAHHRQRQVVRHHIELSTRDLDDVAPEDDSRPSGEASGQENRRRLRLEASGQTPMTEEEEKIWAAREERNQKHYQSLEKKKGGKVRIPTKKELEAQLAQQMAERDRQMALIQQHHDHLEARLQAEKIPRLLPSLLDTYSGVGHLSLGTLWWDAERCLPDWEASGEWAVQRMVYHWPHVYCTLPESFPRWEMCTDYHGHRKYAVDPRTIITLQIHKVVENTTAGIDLDTTIAKVNHFQGLLRKGAETCTQTLASNESLVWWARGYEINDIAEVAQKHPIARFTQMRLTEEDLEFQKIFT